MAQLVEAGKVRHLGLSEAAADTIRAIRSVEDLDPEDFRRMNPRFQGDNFGHNLDLVSQVEKVAQARGATPSQLALAWVLARGGDIVPIPGTTKCVTWRRTWERPRSP